MAKNPKIGSTQEHLAFSEVHDGVVITKNGELRVILMATSVNFSLKSEQEQNAIVFAYQNFLNSLTFPIQILMQSKKLDLGKYITKLKGVVNTQTNELLRAQTLDYIDFISRLIQIANIMDKKFYIVIPFTPPPKIQPTGGFFGGGKKQSIEMNMADFNNYKQELKQRVEVIINGLGSIGIRSAALNTQQTIELLYGIYNPEEAGKQKLIEQENLSGNIVESEIEKPEESHE